MKPCAQNQKRLCLLAIDELKPSEAAELQTHLESCAGCRQYLTQISKVTGELTAAKNALPPIEPSEQFHRKLTQRIQAAERPGVWTAMFALMRQRGEGWQLALPLFVLGGLTVLLLWTAQRDRRSTPTAIAPVKFVAQQKAEVAPTFGNYRMLADRSLDALDKELSREASAAPANTPIYTVASITRALAAD